MLTRDQRTLIEYRLGQVAKEQEIANEIPCSVRTIRNVKRMWLQNGSIEPKKIRIRKTTEEQDMRIVETAVLNRFDTVNELREKVKELDTSRRT